MALLILSAVAIAVVMYMFPIYEVTTTGTYDGQRFTIKEDYYVDHYEITSDSIPIYDTDSDGTPDSKSTGAILYKDRAVLDDNDATNNLGWGGSYQEHGQKEKASVYQVTYWAMIVGFAFAGLSLILAVISGFRKMPLWLPRITYAGFIIAAIVVLLYGAVMFASFGGAAYEDDKRENFYVFKADILAANNGTPLIVTYDNQHLVGSDYNGKVTYGTQRPVTRDVTKAYQNTSSEGAGPLYVEKTTDMYWTPDIGLKMAGSYALSQSTDPDHDITELTWDKTDYGPQLPGWFILIAPVFLGLIAVFLLDQNVEKVNYKRTEHDDFEESYTPPPQTRATAYSPPRQPHGAYGNTPAPRQPDGAYGSTPAPRQPQDGYGSTPARAPRPGPGPVGPVGPAPLEDETYDQY